MSEWVIVDELPEGEVKDKLIIVFEDAFGKDRGMNREICGECRHQKNARGREGGKMLKRIGDKLSKFIDWLDLFIDEEIEYFKGLFPYRGKRFKK